MESNMKKLIIAGVITSLFSTAAMAEDDKTWAATAELGGTMTTGNTDTSTLKARLDATHTLAEWQNEYYFDTLYSKDDDEKTASRWKIGAKGAYVLDETSNIFILGEHEQDEFSTYDSVSSLAAGYSKNLFKSETATFDADLGPGMKFFDVKEGDSEKTGILHVGLSYENALSETSKFTQVLTSDIAFEDEKSTISRSETAITANIMGELAMKLGFIVRHDNNAADDKKSVDTEATITLLYTF
jgi:putative salt-induced outer membrane protein YdiY